MDRKALASCLSLLLLASAPAAAGRPKARARAATRDDYEQGLLLYSKGRLPEALAAFRSGLRAHPRDPAIEIAIERVQREISAGGAAAAWREDVREGAPFAPAEPSWSERFDRFVLVDAPRWLNPELFLGERIAQVGTLEALRGRVAQLLCERRLALARRRPFRKERELRALVRRMPVVVVV